MSVAVTHKLEAVIDTWAQSRGDICEDMTTRRGQWATLYSLSKGHKSHDLTKDDIMVGSSDGCDLVVPAPTEERKFMFRIKRKEQRVTLEAYTNLFINDGIGLAKGKKTSLQHNMKITIPGRERLRANGISFVYMDRLNCDLCNYPSKVKEKYDVSLQLGSGGFGEVYLVFNKRNHARYAMKIVKIPDEKEKYAISEAKHLKGLNHPCIIKLNEVIQPSKKELYVFLEYMEGGDLSKYLKDGKRLTESQTKLVFLQLAFAVDHLHQNGIVHRDLKPENILLSEDSLDCVIKVADFGLSKSLDDSSMNTLAGTKYFMAPEIITVSFVKHYTKVVDIWSMGVILFYCLTGCYPFSSQALLNKALHPHFDQGTWLKMSVAVSELTKRMLEKKPEDRISIKQVLGSPWFQDETVKRRVEQLTGLKLPVSSPEKKEEPKRIFNFHKPKPEPSPVAKPKLPVQEQRGGTVPRRHVPQPRGVMQFMTNVKPQIIEEKNSPLLAPKLYKKIAEPQKVQVQHLPTPTRAQIQNPPVRRDEKLLTPKIPRVIASPQIKRSTNEQHIHLHKVEQTFLVDAKRNLKPAAPWK